ncbi:MAG: hypothetical protein INR65_07025 [Gluconacetobacter diazotrophicus]|nr:hypothetical protein [Gluconacetobacter diazotrophicus]
MTPFRSVLLRVLACVLVLFIPPRHPARSRTPPSATEAGPDPLPSPMAGYAFRLLAPGHAAPGSVPDLLLRRIADGRLRRFAFRSDNTRDIPAIAALLGNGTGRVERVFDQFGSHRDLVPLPNTRGPLVLADPTAPPGLRFDDAGAFEGVHAPVGDPYWAVSLSAAVPPLDLSRCVSMVAALRLGNVASVSGAPILSLRAPSDPYPLVLDAGSPDPARPEAQADDLFLFHGRTFRLSPPPASTPSLLAVAVDGAGFSVLSDAGSAPAPAAPVSRRTVPLPTNRTWNTLVLGTDRPGAGFELFGLLLFDRRLFDAALSAWAARLRPLAAPAASRLPRHPGAGRQQRRGRRRQHRAAQPVPPLRGVPARHGDPRRRRRRRPHRRTPPCPARHAVAAGRRLYPSRPAVRHRRQFVRHRPVPGRGLRPVAAHVREAHAAVPGLLVGLATLIPNGGAIDVGRGAAFAPYNALVRANAAGADFVSDRAADPAMGDPARFRPVDPAVSRDGAHPTDAGTARLAVIDAAAIRAALRSQAASTDPSAAASSAPPSAIRR